MFTLYEILRRRNRPATLGLFDTALREARVGLADIDFNLHLNNAKYLRYMEHGRLEHMIGSRLLYRLFSAKVNLVIANAEIQYIRELRTWQRFAIETRLLGWDGKYLYYDQRFLAGGRLCTHAYFRLAGLYGGKAIGTGELLARTGTAAQSPALPEPVLVWKQMLEARKRLTLGTQAPQTLEEKRHVA